MSIQTINPFSEGVVKTYKVCKPKELDGLIEDNCKAFQLWKGLDWQQRLPFFKKFIALLGEHEQELAEIMTKEMGKPISQSKSEVQKCQEMVETIVQKAPEWLAIKSPEIERREIEIRLEPLGPILGIMPWNFPLWQSLRFAVPTCLVGNSILLKSAPETMGTGELIQKIFETAGFPKGLITHLIIDQNTTSALVKDSRVRGVSLTGSTKAGMSVGESAGKSLKKCVLELGGSDPFILFEDYDVEKAARMAAKGRLLNCGQSCISPKRLFVPKSKLDEFCEVMVREFKEAVLGDPLDPNTTVGPLVSKKALNHLEKQIKQSSDSNSQCLYKADLKVESGYFYPPSVFTYSGDKGPLFREEIFGPIAVIIPYHNEAEAIEKANQTNSGLGASLWTRDIEKAKELIPMIESGMVSVNTLVRSHPLLPFGGIKESGIGRELSEHGIKEFLNIKTVEIKDP